VGIATVKGLGFGSSLRVAPVSTLQALAFEVAPEEARGLPVAALLDARREDVYAGIYANDPLRPDPAMEEGVYAVEELAARLPAACALVGSGADLYADALGAGSQRVLWPGRAPSARSVAQLGRDLLARGEGVLVAALVPRYLRRSDAEVARERLGRA
jgi:tRNA threonylcarbamoyladenosine biosynthesis protein TsaB